MTVMVIVHAPEPTQADRDREQAKHDHRLDITAVMVAADPCPGALYRDLVATYGQDSADLLMALAAEVAL